MSQEEIAISYSFARPWKNNHHGGSSFKLYFLLCSSSPLKGRHFNRHNWPVQLYGFWIGRIGSREPLSSVQPWGGGLLSSVPAWGGLWQYNTTSLLALLMWKSMGKKGFSSRSRRAQDKEIRSQAFSSYLPRNHSTEHWHKITEI